MIWTLYGAIMRPSGDRIYPRYLQEVMWNLHLSAWAKSPLVWSLQSTSWTWSLCSENIVRIDEDVIQIYDDYDVDNICKNFIHNLWKAVGALVSPSGITNHLNGFGVQSSIRLQVKSIQGGTCAGDCSWCRLVPFVVHLGGQKWVEVGIGISWKFQLRPWKLMQCWREPSFPNEKNQCSMGRVRGMD